MERQRSKGKTRPSRKHRPDRLGDSRHAKLARRTGRTALTRVVKARGAALPAPANDTSVAGELGGALPEIIAAEPGTAPVATSTESPIETSETALLDEAFEGEVVEGEGAEIVEAVEA